jgi:DNA modification methylase
MRRTNLKLVEGLIHYKDQDAFWSEDGVASAHSIHHLMGLPESSRPEFAQYFIERYSSPGDIVLDPFCGAGTVAFEAFSRGRLAYASDINPIAVRTTESKLDPADITEVTLFLQMINLRKPVNANVFRQVFSPFFDLNTYRELVNLRIALQGASQDRVARFVQMLTCSLLHGHTASYLSVYSSPQLSLRPEEQEAFNIKRRQIPDYRSVVPRILRKAAMVMRDGHTSSMRKSFLKQKVAQADARDLRHVANGAVRLALMSPPVPNGRDLISETWLKSWFSGISEDALREKAYPTADLDSDAIENWLEFISETLMELTRVVAAGGRAVINLGESAIVKSHDLDNRLLALAQEGFSRYWEPECTLINLGRELNKSEKPQGARSLEQAVTNRVLVLRRR